MSRSTFTAHDQAMLLIRCAPVNRRGRGRVGPFIPAAAGLQSPGPWYRAPATRVARGCHRHGLLSAQSFDAGGKARSPEIVVST